MADVLPEPAARQKTPVDNDKLQPKLPSLLKKESVSSGAERDSTALAFTSGYSVEHSATDWHLQRLWSVAERALALLWCTAAATMIYFDFSVCGRLLRSPTTDA